MLFVTIMNKKPANMKQFHGLHEVVHLLQRSTFIIMEQSFDQSSE